MSKDTVVYPQKDTLLCPRQQQINAFADSFCKGIFYFLYYSHLGGACGLQIGFITGFLTILYTVYLLAFIAITTLILATIFLRIFSLIGEYMFVFFLEYLSLSFDNRLSPPPKDLADQGLSGVLFAQQS